MAVGVVILWAGYSAFFYGLDQLRGGNHPFLCLIVPGRYGKAGCNQKDDKAGGANWGPSGSNKVSPIPNPLNSIGGLKTGLKDLGL